MGDKTTLRARKITARLYLHVQNIRPKLGEHGCGAVTVAGSAVGFECDCSIIVH